MKVSLQDHLLSVRDASTSVCKDYIWDHGIEKGWESGKGGSIPAEIAILGYGFVEEKSRHVEAGDESRSGTP